MAALDQAAFVAGTAATALGITGVVAEVITMEPFVHLTGELLKPKTI